MSHPRTASHPAYPACWAAFAPRPSAPPRQSAPWKPAFGKQREGSAVPVFGPGSKKSALEPAPLALCCEGSPRCSVALSLASFT